MKLIAMACFAVGTILLLAMREELVIRGRKRKLYRRKYDVFGYRRTWL